jgi:hypothetical protein
MGSFAKKVVIGLENKINIGVTLMLRMATARNI